MADAFYGEISIFPYFFAPRGWVVCDGSFLPISQFDVLYAVIGDSFGGTGYTTFCVPNLERRAPLGAGEAPGLTQYPFAIPSGYLSITLSEAHIPEHKHKLIGSLDITSNESEHSDQSYPSFMDKKNVTTILGYADADSASLVQMSPNSLANSGSSQPHENRQPFMAMQYCICVDGLWPQRS